MNVKDIDDADAFGWLRDRQGTSSPPDVSTQMMSIVCYTTWNGNGADLRVGPAAQAAGVPANRTSPASTHREIAKGF